MVSEISSSEYAIDDTLSRLRNLALLSGAPGPSREAPGFWGRAGLACASSWRHGTSGRRPLAWPMASSEDSAVALPLLLVLHLTPMGGVLPDKKGLQGRLNLLPEHGTLL